MKKFHVLTVACAAAAFLAGCGGNSAGDQSPRVAFTQMVSFGDSLSDVGSYNVGVVAAQGGGHYSINGQGATGLLWTNWTEFLSATLKLSAPCAAETGLNTYGAAVPATFHDASAGGTCLNYAQGGSRVTNAVGPGNIALFNPGAPVSATNSPIGQLTVPVVTQIGNYLTNNGGSFNDNQLVTVFAGGNDVFINVATFQAQVAGGVDQTTAATAAVTAMGQAGGELAAYVKQLVLAKGASHVVVVNLPDVSLTPYAISAGAAAQALVKQMTQTFNQQLQAGLTASASLVFVDAFTASEDQATNSAQYGLSDVTHPACDLTVVSSSLVCTKSTLISAVAPAASSAPATLANTYEYADSVHPTPYGYRLLAELVGEQLAIKGWL
jgi:phospholipase/lecithinase/hemolysin